MLQLLFIGLAAAQVPPVASQLERVAPTPEAKIAYAMDANVDIAAVLMHISELLDQARKDGDAEAVRCVAANQTSVKVLLPISEAAAVAMQEALDLGLVPTADRELRKVAVAAATSQRLLAEAQRCLGETSGSEDTIVEWETSLAPERPTTPAEPTPPDPTVPPISPFL